jgi:hypothetical protein
MKNLMKYFLNVLVFLIPVFLGLQSFLPKYLETIFIALKLVFFPLLIFFLVANEVHKTFVVLLIVYFLILFFLNWPYDLYDFEQTFLSLFASFSYFIFGESLFIKRPFVGLEKFLALGVGMFSAVTLVLYSLIYLGFIDIFSVYSEVGRDDEIDLFRFSLGNAIEVPFTMSCVLLSSILLNRGRNNFIIVSALNLICAFISQSRIVVLIALLILINEFKQASGKSKLLFSIFLSSVIYFIPFELFTDIWNSSLERFTGNDAGSKDNRIEFLYVFLQGFDLKNFFIGGGLTYSSQVMKNIYGSYQTLESVYLQLLFDSGFFISSLIIFPILKRLFNLTFFSNVSVVLKLGILFVAVEIFFFLPYYTSMIAAFFVFSLLKFANLNTKNAINYNS